MTAQTFLSALIVQKTGKKVCAAYTRTHERRHAHIEASMSTQIKGAHPSGQQRFWCPCAPSHTKACTHSTHTYAHTRTHTQAHTHKHTHTHTHTSGPMGRPEDTEATVPTNLATRVLGRSRWGMWFPTQQGARHCIRQAQA